MRFFLLLAVVSRLSAQTIILNAPLILDGRGNTLRNQQVEIIAGKITRIAPKLGTVTYDLAGLTLMPGWIDTHVHLDWYFDKAGKLANRANETPQAIALHTAENAWVTLRAGFTTVQSVGSPNDVPVRDRINEGALPGPRILTSVRQINDKSGDAEAIRALVRQTKSEGADVIKLFATLGLGAGGEQSMTDEQILAACGEAKAQGLRSVVHSISSKGSQASVRAGCTSIEHGDYLDDETLQLIADRGAFFDPNFLVLHNYIDLKEHFAFSEASLANLAKAIDPSADVLRRARLHHVKVVFGTDALAGAHGRNAEEFIYRVKDAGEKPMDAIVSATGVAADSLGMGTRIGGIAVGFEADLVAVEGNPLEDITAVRRVAFVMKAGKVYVNRN